ncbi:MAG: FAD-dependent monooxygenase [Cyclobacteriaceae bacterium]
MMNARQTTFLILGGGIAGLTCAIALQQKGIDAMVAEGAGEFRPAGAGITLAANAMKAYRYLGLDELITQAGNPLEYFEVLDRKGKTISAVHTNTLGDGTPPVSIHRGTLHQVLLDRVKSDCILNGFRAKTIEQQENRYRVSFDNGEAITAEYVIAADGIRSIARNTVLPSSMLRYSGYTCWRGVAENDVALPLTKATETWGTASRFGLVPIEGNKIYWFAVKNAPCGSERMKAYTREDIQRDFAHYHAPVEHIISQTPPEDIIHSDIYDLKPISQFAFGNMVLIGDAAHATTPNMGQGACQAIEDAVILADCITRHSVIAEAFKDFEQRRMERVHGIVNRSWTMGKVGQLQNNALAGMRNVLFRSLPSSLMRKQLEEVSEFKLN